MAEPVLASLFRPQDIQAIAERVPLRKWQFLASAPFEQAIDDLEQGRISGEANTREKIIEPILYEVLGFDRSENDAEHAVKYAGAGGTTGAVEYFFRMGDNTVPIEAKSWKKPLDKKDSSGRSPVRQAFDYAGLSNSRWFIVTNGWEWRLYKTQLKGSESPLGACERYFVKEMSEHRKVFHRFYTTFERSAFLPDRSGVCRLDVLRRKNEGWQQQIGDSLYGKLVEARLELYRAIQARLPEVPQEEVNEAVVKLLFRVMFILFAEHTPLLPEEFLVREVIQRYESDRKWGRDGSLYRYVQQYFAWLDGRASSQFDIYPYDGTLFDPDPILDRVDLQIDDELFKRILLTLSRETPSRSIDYSQVNPRILGNIYEKFLGYVIEVKEGRVTTKVQEETRRSEGTVYTPEPVTKFLVEHCVDEARRLNPHRQPWELRCLDPACGSGHFLVEYVNYVARLCEDRDDARSFAEWKRYVTEHCVFGVDKDRTAVMLTKLSLWINSAMKDVPFASIDTHVKCGNSLVCGVPPGFRLAEYERRAYPDKFRELKRLRRELAALERRADSKRPLLGPAEALDLHRQVRQALQKVEEAKASIAEQFTREARERWAGLGQTHPFHWEIEFAEVFEEHEGFDVVVGNPPWGADLSEIHDYLESGAFELARGQYDSYELFVELGRRLLHGKGLFGFIVPDSIVLPEHEPLRRIVLDNTTVTRLVRAGEGLFPSVFRGAYFLCFENAPPAADHSIRVATIRKGDRKLLEQDSLVDPPQTIEAVVTRAGHDTAQSRFRGNPRYAIDILATNIDARIIARIDQAAIEWTELTTKGRGVEIGKSGEILQCPFCYRWDNVPRKSKGTWREKVCLHCKRTFTYDEAARHETIIAERAGGKAWKPIIPGESVNRYVLGPVQYIETSKDGIHYKDEEFYQGKRLLFRQTGVGIYATIDSSGRLTNQSVFTWKLRSDLSEMLANYQIEYVLGVLNSLTMLYRSYMKTGDTEWRSFPRWTQELVQDLPIRAIDFSDPSQKKLHDGIARRAGAILESGEPPTDHEFYGIEKLVMQLYGITKPMCRRIFEVLHGVQRLRIIREVNLAKPDMLLDVLPD